MRKESKKLELSKGEKIFLKNVVEDLRELGKFSIKYKEIYEFEDENLNLVCSSFQNWLNNIFTYMNSRLQAKYFHAKDSRDFIELNEKIEEFEKALTEKIVTRYNIIERNEASEEETIIKNSNDIPITIIYAVAYLHKYTKETQMQELKHLNNIYIISENKYMVLDSIARKNLELTQRMKDRK